MGRSLWSYIKKVMNINSLPTNVYFVSNWNSSRPTKMMYGVVPDRAEQRPSNLDRWVYDVVIVLVYNWQHGRKVLRTIHKQ